MPPHGVHDIVSSENHAGQRRAHPIRDVLNFVLQGWARQRRLVAAIGTAMLAATLADLLVPIFAGRLVDAAALADRDLALRAMLAALAALALLGLAACSQPSHTVNHDLATAPADAFNSGLGVRRLAPGETWTVSWGVQLG